MLVLILARFKHDSITLRVRPADAQRLSLHAAECRDILDEIRTPLQRTKLNVRELIFHIEAEPDRIGASHGKTSPAS